MVWTEQYSVGSSQLDSQHRQLIELVNELHESILSGSDSDVLNVILQKLLAYTHVHFNTEERLMQSANYPQFEDHQAQHDQLAAQVIDYIDGLRAGRLKLTISVSQHLHDWLERHIVESDVEFGEFLGETQQATTRLAAETR